MKRFSGLVDWARRPAKGGGLQAAPTAADHYEQLLRQALAVFRFFSFAMGVGLVVTLGQNATIANAAAMTVVGIYNLARVAFRFNPARQPSLVQSADALGDLAMAMALVLVTGALDSPFLIYSLAPTVSASLLLNARTAATLGVTSAAVVSGAHLAGGLGLRSFPWILGGNYLAFSLLYTVACLLVGYLPFLANLNWQDRIRTESRSQEFQRLRREVHDNVAQTLAFLSLKVKRAEERAVDTRIAMSANDVREIGRTVERCYLTIRDYLDGSVERMSNVSLEEAIRSAAEQWGQASGLKVEVSIAGGESPQLSADTRYQLVQIMREALANVSKHARTDKAWVSLASSISGVELRIRDQGRGFAVSEPWGHGLDIMQERAAVIGARVTVTSKPGDGTEVVAQYGAVAEELSDEVSEFGGAAGSAARAGQRPVPPGER